MNRHDEQQINAIEERLDLGKGSGRVQGEPGPATRLANPGQCFSDVVPGFRFHVDGNGIRAGFHEAGKVMIGPLDHQMHIKGELRQFARHRDDHRPEGNVIHEMTVHDVAVNPVGPGFLHPAHFPGEVREISRQDGRGDEDGRRRHESDLSDAFCLRRMFRRFRRWAIWPAGEAVFPWPLVNALILERCAIYIKSLTRVAAVSCYPRFSWSSRARRAA